ncbi:DUF1127 domain-containing protein [Pelagibius sp. Alg239-R121]|uniref:DUF1127 domain-containing protein n=1 Tax=Pelagibius sp. Alg239-R121 TaxID=2993448 RepID=UPI0024A77282|nr:DUF1127 domain-containing protein [Pelagibius sp. Alg239-R121]
MTNFSTHTHARPVGFAIRTPADVLLSPVRIVMYLFNVLLLWQDRATQRHHLASLSDRRLRDMGLTPTDVGKEVSKPFWRA